MPDDQIEVTVEVNADERFGADAEFAQTGGDLVGAGVEFAIREIYAIKRERDRAGMERNLGFNPAGQNRAIGTLLGAVW